MASSNSTQTAATLFNGYVASCTIAALHRLGLMERLAHKRGLTLDETYEGLKIPRERFQALVATATRLGVFKSRRGQRLQLSPLGHEVHREIGFFVWAVNGYGPLFNSLFEIAHEGSPEWSQYRNGAMVALGSDLCNEHLMQPILDEILGSLSFGVLADLGCGNAGRLIKACEKFQDIKALGIDINRDAILMARRLVKARGLAGRLSLHQADVFKSTRRSGARLFSSVDVVMSFMMLHDLFNMGEPSAIVRQVKSAFPNARSFIFADTVRTSDVDDKEAAPIFCPGFELIHGYMGIRTFPLKTYLDAFKGAGLQIDHAAPFGAPNTYIFLLSST